MSGMIQNEFYRVRVVDYAIPAICDSEVDYYDTAENIRLLYERSLTGRIQEEAEHCLAAMDEYLSGRGAGAHFSFTGTSIIVQGTTSITEGWELHSWM